MTVSYTAEVATSKKFGSFIKLLFRWRASIYKLVWLDLIIFLIFYYLLHFIYVLALSEESKRTFEFLVSYFSSYGSLIPLSFVLGFYVRIVVERWWDQYMQIPWPDPIATFVSAHVHGQDDRGRVMRRTVMRYAVLCLTMVLTMVSSRVKKRLPTYDHLIDLGLLLENEKVIIENLNEKFPKYSKHWMPIVWATSIIARARREGRIRDDFALNTIINEINKFRGQCGALLQYDHISIPLVYTQVVALAVYTYFLCSAIGRQLTEKDNIYVYFPISTTMEFFFYIGWLKVAETLINPFGEDDDDFEVNWLIDRNIQVSYLIVDEMHHEHPELVRDQYWDEVFPSELPYADNDAKRDAFPEHSTAKLDLPKSNPVLSNVIVHETRSKSSIATAASSISLGSKASKASRAPVVTYSDLVDYKTLSLSSDEIETVSRKRLLKYLPNEEDEYAEEFRKSSSDDDFERLRMEREKERQERMRQKLLNLTSAQSALSVEQAAERVKKEEDKVEEKSAEDDKKKDDKKDGSPKPKQD